MHTRRVRSALLTLHLTGCIAFFGCSTANQLPKGYISHLPESSSGVSLEVAATVDDQARAEILATKTSFTVGLDDERAAWDRTRLFFENFLPLPGQKSTVITKAIKGKMGLLNPPTTGGRFQYEVSREEIKSGAKYQVICQLRAAHSRDVVALQQCELNARNISRFIQEGRFEASLLER